jgi:hypothetical protein
MDDDVTHDVTTNSVQIFAMPDKNKNSQFNSQNTETKK